MTSFKCQKCGADIDLTDELSTQLKTEVRALAYDNKKVEAMMILRNHASLDITQAKAAIIHLAVATGRCHRCNTQLTATGEVVCTKCKSFNLNW